MNTKIKVAWIGFVGAVFVALLTLLSHVVTKKDEPKHAQQPIVLNNYNIQNTGPQNNVRSQTSPETEIRADQRQVSRPEKGVNQHEPLDELRAPGLLRKLQAARGYIEGGNSNDIQKALKLYNEVLKQLSRGTLRKLNRSLLADAQKDEKETNNELAARKYRSLFRDYGG
jgi:hypothetical protein